MLELRIGSVFHLWCRGCRYPKWKYHVLALIEPKPRYFIINTNPPPFYRDRPLLMAHQIGLSATDHPFLHHDSFIDTSSLLGGLTASELEDAFDADNRTKMGEVNRHVRKLVRSAVVSSEVLSERDIQMLLAVW